MRSTAWIRIVPDPEFALFARLHSRCRSSGAFARYTDPAHARTRAKTLLIVRLTRDSTVRIPARTNGRPLREEGAAEDVIPDVRAFLEDRRTQTDQWFFLVRMILGVGLAGYLLVDALGKAGISTVEIVLVGTYLLCNVLVWFTASPSFRFKAWFFAGLDFLIILLHRHLFLFEATVDPNATMVAFLSLMVVAYVSYGDAKLISVLAIATIVATGFSIWLELWRLDGLALAVRPADISFRTQPLRVLLLLAYLSAVGLVSRLVARRLELQVTTYGAEIRQRAEGAMTAAVERAKRERLEELNRLKRDFISILSHELRTPIAPLRTSLELVQRELNGNHSAQEMIDIAVEASTRLQRLVQDYTRLAELLTLETGMLEQWNMRLRDLLVQILPAPYADRFLLDGVEKLTVSGDPRLLGGAIVALIRRAELVTPADLGISIRARRSGSDVELAVHDPLSYVDQDSTLNLSDLFACSSERTFFSANTGLELILAQHSIHRAGGDIRVESARDRGTVVFITVPAAQPGRPWLGRDELRAELSAFAF